MAKSSNEVPQTSVQFDDFPGIALLQDPTNLAPGAGQDQLNLKSDVAGQATVRGGVLPVSFDFSA